MNQSSSMNNFEIPDMYRQINHISQHGIEGYHVENKYFDPTQKFLSKQQATKNKVKLRELKRGNYLDDQARAHKHVPGPGKYQLKMVWPQKSKSLHKEPDRKTYIQELMDHQKKEKKPAPGHYKTFKSQKQIQAQKKALASKKINIPDRITYLDHIQYESTQTPGIGAYNPRKRVKTEGSKIKTNPEDWRKKHEKQGKKKAPKFPDMGTYHPVPSSYELFETIKKQRTGKHYLGKVQRFKTEKSGSGLGPGKYTVIQQWRGKQEKIKDRHGLQSITKGTSKSVYYH